MRALTQTILELNPIFATFNRTWLQGVGSLSAANLTYSSPLEFWREIMEVLPEILGVDFDPTWSRIVREARELPDASLIDFKVATTIRRNLSPQCA